jgi:hypothetical protein
VLATKPSLGSSIRANPLGPFSSATSAMEYMERRLARLRGVLCRKLSVWLVVRRRRSACVSLSLLNSRDDFDFSRLKWPFKLFVRPELFEAMLGALERRGAGSALIVPNAVSSGAALTDVYESLDSGRTDESVALNGLNLGDFGDLGDGGALAIRMTGDEAASSGCKRLCGGSSAVA